MFESGFEDFEKLQKIKISLEGYYFGGLITARLGRAEEASNYFDKAINFRDSEEYKKLSDEEKYFEDECWYDRIVHLYLCQAETLFVLKRYEEALECGQKHIEFADQFSLPYIEVYIILAYIHAFGLINLEKSLDIFDEIIQKYEREFNPKTKILYQQRGKFFEKLGMKDEAEKDFEIAENLLTI